MKKRSVILLLALLMAAGTPARVYANADAEDETEEYFNDEGDEGEYEQISGNSASDSSASDSATAKTVTVPIGREYLTCEFHIKYENPGTYSTTITSPDGDVYTANQNTDTVSTADIAGVGVGDWTVSVVSDNGTPIGRVTVDVSAVAKSRNPIIDEVPVAKDINGLSIYFKDTAIVAEWNDTSVGSVHAVVYNTKNQVQIANEKIPAGQNYFEAEIPPSVEQITISIVPTASEGFGEAETIRTYKVENNPNATVTFPKVDFTNKDTYDFSVTLGDRYGLIIEDNGIEQETVALKDAGDYEYSVDLEEGVNEIKVYVVDADGNRRSSQTEVVMDTVPPTLVLNETYSDTTTESDTITIAGNARDFQTIVIDGYDVEARGNGDFSFDVPLFDGSNSIDVVVTDAAGNSVSYTAHITKLVPEENNMGAVASLFMRAAGLVAALFALILFLLHKFGFLQFSRKGGVMPPAGGGDAASAKKGRPSKKKGPVSGEDREEPEEEAPSCGKEPGRGKRAKKARAKESKKGGINLELLFYAMLPVTAFLMVTFVVYLGTVVSGSMEPTMDVGDCVITNRLAYMVREPERGDVVAFMNHGYSERDEGAVLLKRIIGLPGDSISFKDGDLYINDELCQESYLAYDTETNSVIEGEEFEVPDGCFFMLGDNRGDSLDSRFWENPYVARADLVGRYLYSFHLPDAVYNAFFSPKPDTEDVELTETADSLTASERK